MIRLELLTILFDGIADGIAKIEQAMNEINEQMGVKMRLRARVLRLECELEAEKESLSKLVTQFNQLVCEHEPEIRPVTYSTYYERLGFVCRKCDKVLNAHPSEKELVEFRLEQAQAEVAKNKATLARMKKGERGNGS